MKAVRIHRFGGPEVLTCEEVPRPNSGQGQVIVQVGQQVSDRGTHGFGQVKVHCPSRSRSRQDQTSPA
jgi:hypothetical protein